MTRARDLARLGNRQALTVDTNLNVGIGSSTPDAKLDVVGIVSATAFYGDGANLTNTGSTLSAASGTQRVVVTSQTSGTMTASATDADLTFDASTNTLSVPTSIVGSAVTINSSGVHVTGVVTATSFVGNVTGNVTGDVTGNLTGNATGLSGTPDIVVGIVTASTVNDVDGDVRTIPQNSQASPYVLVASDSGKHVFTTSGVTVPASVFSTGDAVTIFNNTSGNITITSGSGITLRQVGTANTGNRTLAQYGLATVLCVASDTFAISGGGLS